MSSLICGYSEKENVAFIGSDTAWTRMGKDENGNGIVLEKGDGSEKVYVIGGKMLLGTTGNINACEEVLNAVKEMTEPQEVLDTIKAICEPNEGGGRVSGFLLHLNQGKRFVFYYFNGREIPEGKNDGNLIVDNRFDSPYTFEKHEEIPGFKGVYGSNDMQWYPDTKENGRKLISSLAAANTSLVFIAQSILLLIGKMHPHCNAKLFFWTLDRDGNIKKIRNDK